MTDRSTNANGTDSEFLEWVKGYREWYARSAWWWAAALVTCRLVTLLSTLAAAVLAALMQHDGPFGFSNLKGPITVAALLGMISTTLLSRFQVQELQVLRERGRAEATDIAAYTRDKFLQFADSADRKWAIRDEVRLRIRRLEEEQAERFSAAWRQPVDKSQPPANDGKPPLGV